MHGPAIAAPIDPFDHPDRPVVVLFEIPDLLKIGRTLDTIQIVVRQRQTPLVLGHQCERGRNHFGFNAQSEEYGDMLAMGIIDPAKVTKSALQNAISVATLLLTTDALIANKPDPKPAGGGGGGEMDGMDDMGGMGGMGGMGF